MGGEAAIHGLTTGEWLSFLGLVIVIVLQIIKWASDKGEARAMRTAMKEQMDEIKCQLTKIWERSDEHSTEIAFLRGRLNDGRFSRVVDHVNGENQ